MLEIVQNIDGCLLVMFQITTWIQVCSDWFSIIARQAHFQHVLCIFNSPISLQVPRFSNLNQIQ